MLPNEIVIELRDFFVLQNTIHWIKSITIEDRDSNVRSYGHFKPINSKRFLNDCHEYIFHFTKTGHAEIDRLALGVPYQDKSNISRWSHTRGSDLRCRGNTWFIPYETIQSRAKERPHPATFPVQLAEWCIKLHGASHVQTMLDPFLGIGNSALAAQRCGVKKFIGFEIDRLALGVPYQDKSNIARWSHTRGSDLRCRGNTWFIPYETIQSGAKERPHPATFPVQLAEWCIKLHGASRVQTMVDPFLGIGNSAIAAQYCGVKRFIGFEIDKTYLAEAKRRVSKIL